jgi:hypothetical protein
MTANLNWDVINKLNIKLDANIDNIDKTVKTNVAIASAITSYARIEMNTFKMLLNKLGINIYYTDTYSVFTDKPLPPFLVGKGLGKMKDELNGKTIVRAIFLGNKNIVINIIMMMVKKLQLVYSQVSKEIGWLLKISKEWVKAKY